MIFFQTVSEEELEILAAIQKWSMQRQWGLKGEGLEILCGSERHVRSQAVATTALSGCGPQLKSRFYFSRGKLWNAEKPCAHRKQTN